MRSSDPLRAPQPELDRKVGFLLTFLRLWAGMQVQLVFTRGCVDCLAIKVLIKRLRPDYPDLEVEEIDLTTQPRLAAKYGLHSTPGIVINGRLVARKHIKEAELRRTLLRRRRSRVL